MKLPLLTSVYIQSFKANDNSFEEKDTFNENSSVIKLEVEHLLYSSFYWKVILFIMVNYYTYSDKPEMLGIKLGPSFLQRNLENLHNSEHNVKK